MSEYLTQSARQTEAREAEPHYQPSDHPMTELTQIIDGLDIQPAASIMDESQNGITTDQTEDIRATTELPNTTSPVLYTADELSTSRQDPTAELFESEHAMPNVSFPTQHRQPFHLPQFADPTIYEPISRQVWRGRLYGENPNYNYTHTSTGRLGRRLPMRVYIDEEGRPIPRRRTFDDHTDARTYHYRSHHGPARMGADGSQRISMVMQNPFDLTAPNPFTRTPQPPFASLHQHQQTQQDEFLRPRFTPSEFQQSTRANNPTQVQDQTNPESMPPPTQPFWSPMGWTSHHHHHPHPNPGSNMFVSTRSLPREDLENSPRAQQIQQDMMHQISDAVAGMSIQQTSIPGSIRRGDGSGTETFMATMTSVVRQKRYPGGHRRRRRREERRAALGVDVDAIRTEEAGAEEENLVQGNGEETTRGDNDNGGDKVTLSDYGLCL